MLSKFFKRRQPQEPQFVLERADNDTWAIVTKTEKGFDTVGTYTRKRDAIRGAQRRGILLANV